MVSGCASQQAEYTTDRVTNTTGSTVGSVLDGIGSVSHVSVPPGRRPVLVSMLAARPVPASRREAVEITPLGLLAAVRMTASALTSVVKVARTASSSLRVSSLRSALRIPSVAIGLPIVMRIVMPGVTTFAPRGKKTP